MEKNEENNIQNIDNNGEINVIKNSYHQNQISEIEELNKNKYLDNKSKDIFNNHQESLKKYMEINHKKINKSQNVLLRNKVIRNEINENQTQVQNEKGIIVKKIINQRNDDDNNNDKLKKNIEKV
jgi:hypothetical protein